MSNERRFPVLANRRGRVGGRGPVVDLDIPIDVPWSLLALHEAQAQRNHGQTLQRLAERGGLSPFEMWCVVTDTHWRDRDGDWDESNRLALEWLRAVTS